LIALERACPLELKDGFYCFTAAWLYQIAKASKEREFPTEGNQPFRGNREFSRMHFCIFLPKSSKWNETPSFLFHLK